ncbi:hypothetical protein SLS62_002973 [Diatrype stigma]|uniref:Chromatin assembly factor 1 subunit A n=1 Tax=Diatrype stigma TaxID=117547 RepID=A0AAN9UVT7_9PEZI
MAPPESPLAQAPLTQPDQAAAAAMPPATNTKTTTTTTAKRKTAEELEKERAEKKQKKEEKEALKAANAAEKARLLAEKEAAKQAKAAERAKVEAEKEAVRRKKEEEEQALLRKKEKQQNLMASFFKRGPATPVKKKVEAEVVETPVENTSPASRKEAKPEVSAYDRQFKPFFVKPGVKLASNPFEMDEGAKETKSRILDEFVQNKRGEFNPRPFNPVETFQLNGLPLQRGLMPRCVKDIIEQVYGDPFTNTFGTTPIKTESEDERLKAVQDRLNNIPMKYLSFYEDVRPPYFGTMTTKMQCKTLRKLCVNPTRRTVISVNYDYDSEAEWVEEEGEDLDDLEDDEEDEVDEELEDFLDDSEDAIASNRPAFIGELQPASTGLCFENRKRLGPCATMYKYKLEVLLDTLEHHTGIDPFTSSYWEPKVVPTGDGGVTAAATTVAGTMLPPTTSVAAFSKLLTSNPSSASASTSASTDPKDYVPQELLEEFKRTVISEEFREHTKSTVIDLLSKKFTACTKGQLKTTLDRVAERAPVPGGKKSVKYWTLKPSPSLAS